jgi:hypothetical protein
METQSLTKLFGSIIAISLIFLFIMFNIADLETLSLTYDQILQKDPSVAMKLMAVSLIGLGIIAFIADYFFSKNLQEDQLLSKILDNITKNKAI